MSYVHSSRNTILFVLLTFLVIALFVIDMAVGDVDITLNDVWAALTGAGGECSATTKKIVLDFRLLKTVVALIAGVSLSVSGLQMQTLFHNPLADPYILGISSGAGLGVAIFILGAPVLGIAGSTLLSTIGIAGAACIGAATVLIIMVAISRRIKDIMAILIIGIMLGSGVGAVVQMLQYLSNEEALKTFVIWTMGSLGNVTRAQLFMLLPAVMVGLILSIAAIKPLNLLLLGENYARTMGLNINRSRNLVFLSTILLSGTVSAFCGPIGFIGIAAPHMARFFFADADHRILIPGAALIGASVMLFCDIVSKSLNFPINTMTALLGIPIIIWIVMRNKA